MITLKVHPSTSFLQDTDTPDCNLFLEAAEAVGQKQFETIITLAFNF